MKIADLSPEIIERIKQIRYDQFLEKHEGPWDWASEFEYGEPEFMQFASFDVLLPLEKKQFLNITLLRLIVSSDTKTLTIFLKDTTYYSDSDEDHLFNTGRIAICEKMNGTEFYVATLFHACFIVPNPTLRE